MHDNKTPRLHIAGGRSKACIIYDPAYRLQRQGLLFITPYGTPRTYEPVEEFSLRRTSFPAYAFLAATISNIRKEQACIGKNYQKNPSFTPWDIHLSSG